MGIGLSLILIAVGAILTWAVETSVSGLDVNAVGVILMIVGLVGLVLSLAFWSTWWGRGTSGARWCPVRIVGDATSSSRTLLPTRSSKSGTNGELRRGARHR